MSNAPSPVLFVNNEGPAYPRLERFRGPSFLGKAITRLLYDSEFRRNPRTRAYMLQLVDATHGRDAGTVADVDLQRELDVDAIRRARTIVLLWRDGNGCGWSRIERSIFRHKAGDAKVVVLNGRRREFDLDPALWRSYRVRRFLEKSLLPEMGMFLMFWIVAPVIAGWDAARGRD
jgi:hypothetical protein